MVRYGTTVSIAALGSPHPRGDGPPRRPSRESRRTFSPPAWGWSVISAVSLSLMPVLPTRVGMVRSWRSAARSPERSPHPRGDGPNLQRFQSPEEMFSPPAWGWSERIDALRSDECVLPTRVGMVRFRRQRCFMVQRSPHPRGDGPTIVRLSPHPGEFSPPAWGWSAYLLHHGRGREVLPTRVGMVRLPLMAEVDDASSPHPRGDGPDCFWLGNRRWGFSPPAWGWSDDRSPFAASRRVLPTRVGMVRISAPSRTRTGSSPHPRGDGPFAIDGRSR